MRGNNTSLWTVCVQHRDVRVFLCVVLDIKRCLYLVTVYINHSGPQCCHIHHNWEFPQGNFHTVSGGAGDRTGDILTTGQPLYLLFSACASVTQSELYCYSYNSCVSV